jgi:hypothetical protein
MPDNEHIDIVRNPKGYYTLKIDGRFCGNFDTIVEASKEAEQILWEKNGMMEAI